VAVGVTNTWFGWVRIDRQCSGKYEGQWEFNTQEGQGTYTYCNGDRYTGQVGFAELLLRVLLRGIDLSSVA